MLFEVLNAVLAKPALPAADQPLHEVLRLFRHICDMGRELKPLLGRGNRGHVMKAFREVRTDTAGGGAGPAAGQQAVYARNSRTNTNKDELQRHTGAHQPCWFYVADGQHPACN